MASPDTIILLIVDYHAAIGGKLPVPPIAYAPFFTPAAGGFVMLCTTCLLVNRRTSDPEDVIDLFLDVRVQTAPVV